MDPESATTPTRKRARPPEQENALASENEELEPEERQPPRNPSTPPARKILKTLLHREVERALHDLHGESSTLIQTTKEHHRAASLIPEFDPDSEECTVNAWLKKIEQLGEIHGWDDKTKSFHLQDKLRGQARKWYNRLEEYNYKWEEWKLLLLRAFPKHRDYANVLEEMLNRKKLPSESMTKYYQEKVAMCFRCKLSDHAAVSCIIRGLPATLQSNARAFQCQRPDELYEGFLSALDDYRAPLTEQRTWKESSRPTEKKLINIESEPCPRCKKTGHLVRNCPQPDQRSCYKCGVQGHIAPRCPTTQKISHATPEGTVKDIKLLQNYNDIYKKSVKINDTFVKSYVDTGSQVNVLTSQVASLLNLEVKPTSVVLKGFSGGFITSRGEVTFRLQIDNIDLPLCTAYLTNIDMNGIALLIGQPIINAEGISLVVRDGKATLQKEPDFLLSIQVTEKPDRYDVVTTSNECIPPGISIIKVRIIDNPAENNIVTPARHFELQGVSYSLPSTLLRGSEGYLKIINTGAKDIIWNEGDVVVRADSCEETSTSEQVSSQANYILAITSNRPASSSSVSAIGGIDIDKISIGPISEHERIKLINLLQNYSECFASCTNELGCSNLVQMHINLTNNQPVYRRPYRLSHNEQGIVRSKVKELLDAGIIKESESDYASPVILVKKKNGDSRLCVDYRALNSITIRDRYPLPNIDDQVSRLAGKNFFTSLDMAQGYHQLEICPKDTHKTAFITTQGHYEYTRIPFGLANAPSVFMRLVNKLLDTLDTTNKRTDKQADSPNDSKHHPSGHSTEILAFLDDLLLPSVDVQSGLELLQKVLDKLHSENLKLNMSKCTFLQNKITYLGHEISPNSIQPGELKLAAVSRFPAPQNVHEVRQFIGLCSYFRKFIYNFALIARPLTELTKKNSNFVWGEKQIKSFDELKQKLCTKPVLAIYDPSLPTEIHTDACKQGIAGILLQRQPDNTLRPVMYFSRVTTREESMYHSYELETLAVVDSLRRFRVYVMGKHVRVVTDCSAVRDTLTKRDLIPRIARWWLLIQDYDISIDYRPGQRMKHIDALSRNPISSTTELDSVNINRLEMTDWFYTVQRQDDRLNRVIEMLKSNCSDADIVNNYELVDDRLYRKTLYGKRLVVPQCARWRILQMHHDEIGHVGLKRCTEIIKNDYWFPKMSRFIKKYVTSCLHCAYGKGEYGRKEGKLNPIPKPNVPMKMIHIDHLGPFAKSKKQYQYMLVLTDAFSKFVIAEPTRTVNSVETIRVLKKIFSLFGYPERVISDHGKAFTSRYFKKFASDKQFKHTLTAIACPRANGQVERTNRTILDALRATEPSEAAGNWVNSLPDVIWGINNTSNASTGYKPYDLMFAHPGRSVTDIQIPGRSTEPVHVRRDKASKRIVRASETMKRNFDKRRKNCTIYKKGDYVLWKQAPAASGKTNSKLDDPYSGPYIITKVVGNDRYHIRSIKGLRGYKKFTGLVSVDSLRPYQSVASFSDSASSTDDQLETEDLIDLLES